MVLLLLGGRSIGPQIWRNLFYNERNKIVRKDQIIIYRNKLKDIELDRDIVKNGRLKLGHGFGMQRY